MIQIRGLSVRRGEKTLFEQLNVDIQPGKVVTVLGPNGAGKSSFLLSLLNLITRESGDVRFDDQPLPELSRQKLAKIMAWQGDLPPAEFGLTVVQRLLLASDGGAQEEINDALAFMDLEKLRNRALAELSSGERQRVEIAALMVQDNPIWLMDEPTAHLDMRHQADCLKLMKKEAQKGRLIITVLHNLQQAAAVADMVILLDGKAGVEVGAADDMLQAAKLEPVFGVLLSGKGRDLKQVYGEE